MCPHGIPFTEVCEVCVPGLAGIGAPVRYLTVPRGPEVKSPQHDAMLLAAATAAKTGLSSAPQAGHTYLVVATDGKTTGVVTNRELQPLDAALIALDVHAAYCPGGRACPAWDGSDYCGLKRRMRTKEAH